MLIMINASDRQKSIHPMLIPSLRDKHETYQTRTARRGYEPWRAVVGRPTLECMASLFRRQVVGPVGQHCAPRLKTVAALVGAFNGVPDLVCKRGFPDFAVPAGVRRPRAETRAKPVQVVFRWLVLAHGGQADRATAAGTREDEPLGTAPPDARRIATTASDSGCRKSSPLLCRAPATVNVAASRSTSDHSRLITSDGRRAVRHQHAQRIGGRASPPGCGTSRRSSRAACSDAARRTTRGPRPAGPL